MSNATIFPSAVLLPIMRRRKFLRNRRLPKAGVCPAPKLKTLREVIGHSPLFIRRKTKRTSLAISTAEPQFPCLHRLESVW